MLSMCCFPSALRSRAAQDVGRAFCRPGAAWGLGWSSGQAPGAAWLGRLSPVLTGQLHWGPPGSLAGGLTLGRLSRPSGAGVVLSDLCGALWEEGNSVPLSRWPFPSVPQEVDRVGEGGAAPPPMGT